MARWIVAGLITLNIVLGVAVYLRMGERQARADIGKPTVSLATVSGTANNNAIVYILDVNTGRMVALQTDLLTNKVSVMDRRDVGADLARIR